MASLILSGVGAIAGSFFGNPLLGLSVGSVVGGILFPQRGAIPERGKIDDLHITGSSYGAFMPIIYGTMAVGGQLIWATDKVPHEHDVQAGKGGGVASRDYTYTVSCAISFSEGPVQAFEKIWANDLLIYDSGSGTKEDITFYLGDNTQTPDSFIEASIATGQTVPPTAGTTPAYRGTAYILIKNLDLTPYGNAIPQFTAQMFTGFDTESIYAILNDLASRCGLTTDQYDFTMAKDVLTTFTGFIISQRQSVLDSLQQLLSTYFIDLSEYNGKINSVVRGGVTPVTINASDLGTRQWDGIATDAPVRIKTDRTDDLDIPRQFDLNYIDPARNYQAGTQSAIAYEHTTVQEAQSYDTQLAIDHISARRIAEKMLWVQFLERDTHSVSLPYKYYMYPPGANFIVPLGDGEQTARLSSLDLGPLAEMQMQLLPIDDETLVQSQSGSSTTVGTVNDVTTIVPTTFVCFGLPQLQDTDGLSPHFYVAGHGDTGWQGGVIYYSLDGGSTYYSANQSLTIAATFGDSTSTLAAGVTADALDSVNTVDITLTDSGTLTSTSSAEAQTTTTNAAVLGNELISFVTATQTGALDYTLSDIYRGRRASDMTGHTSSDLFVLANDAIAMVKVPDSAIGTAVKVKVVSPGQSLGDVSPCTVTIAAPTAPYLTPEDRTPTIAWFIGTLATGADAMQIPVPGGLTYNITKINAWAETPGGVYSFTVEKYSGTGSFSGTTVGTVTSSSGAHGANTTTSLGQVTGGDKLRANFSSIGTAANLTIEVELQEAT